MDWQPCWLLSKQGLASLAFAILLLYVLLHPGKVKEDDKISSTTQQQMEHQIRAPLAEEGQKVETVIEEPSVDFVDGGESGVLDEDVVNPD